MMSGSLLIRAAIGAAACHATANVAAISVSPVEKVVSLIEGMKNEVVAEGIAEATTYGEFAAFCKKTTESKAKAIVDGQDKIDVTAATMEEKTAKKAEKNSKLMKRKGEQEAMVTKLKESEVRCSKEQATYEADAADLSKGISGLQGALKALGGSKPSAAASFLALRTSGEMERIFDLADALNFMGSPKRQAAAALLQRKVNVDPDDADYKFKSDGILETIGGLLEDFTKEKATLDAEWKKTKDSCDKTKKTLTEDMASNKASMDSLGTAIDTLEAEFAGAKETLTNSEAELKDDQSYLKDLTSRCEDRARDWDQRSSQRGDEIAALSQALEILKNKVKSADEGANERAFVEVHNHPRQPVSFLQLRRAGMRDDSAATTDSKLQSKLARVADLLRGESRRLQSNTLASVASHAAADPFKKVKELIQKLVERLVAEATAEATKKGFCDTAIGKAEKDRDYRFADATKLNVKISGLEVKKDQLEEEIKTLTSSLETLRTALEEATTLRATEKDENLKTLKTAKEGLSAVNDAIAVLKNFYSQAAKASLLQASPVDEDTSGPGFSGSYKGKQGAAGGVLGLLAVIKSDFERTIKTTAASEKESAAEHVEFDRVSNTDISGKETKKKLDEEDLKTTNNDIAQGMEDMQTAMDLTDSALKTLEDLKPTCIDTGMSYKERVQKREEEMTALKNALCILDADGVEEECK